MFRKIALLIATLMLCDASLAAEIGGVKLDDKLTIGGQPLALNGAGIRTRAFFKVYVGSLYLPAKADSLSGVLAKGPRRIQMNLLRDLSADTLVGALVDGLKENNSEPELAAVKAGVDQMVTIMKAFGEVKEGDVVTLDFVDGGTQIGRGGKAAGTIAGEPFNQALTRVWLGEKPVQADLKRAMLGGS